MLKAFYSSVVGCLSIGLSVASVAGQQINIGTPATNVRSSFGGANGRPQFGFQTQFLGNRVRFGLFGEQASSLSLTSQSPSLTLTNGVPGSFHSGFVQPFVTSFTPVVSEQPISPVQAAILQYGMDGIASRLSTSNPATSAKGRRTATKSASPETHSRRRFRRTRTSSASRPDLSVSEIRKTSRSKRKPQRLSKLRGTTKLHPILKLEDLPKRPSNHLAPNRSQ